MTHEEFAKKQRQNNKELWDEIEFHADFVAKMVIARIEKGMSQAQLAQKTGLKQSAIARIEACKCVPKITTVQKILNALDMEIRITSKPVFVDKNTSKVLLYKPSSRQTYEPNLEKRGSAPLVFCGGEIVG